MELHLIVPLFIFFCFKSPVVFGNCPDYNNSLFRSKVLENINRNPKIGLVVKHKVTEIDFSINYAILPNFDPECLESIFLKVKPETGPWEKYKNPTDSSFMHSTFTVTSIIPCQNYTLTFVMKAKNGMLELNKTVGPATKQEILKYHYTPGPPTNVTFKQNGNILSWKSAKCAQLYSVKVNTTDRLIRNMDASPLILKDNLKPCTRYKYQIKTLYQEYSNATIGYFMTGPKKADVENIKLNLDVKKTSVGVNINIPVELSCVKKFHLDICKKKETKLCFENTFNYSSNIRKTFQNLVDNTTYIASLTPMYETHTLTNRAKEFTTKELIEYINITKVANHEIKISWTKVSPPPVSYIIYSQKIVKMRSGKVANYEKIIQIKKTAENSLKVLQKPCEYMRYGVMIQNAQNQQIKWSNDYVIDISKKFSTLKLQVSHSYVNASTIIFNWHHTDIVQSYSIQLCGSDNMTACTLQHLTPGLSTNVEFVARLESCSKYSLQITPKSICGKEGNPFVKEMNTFGGNCQAQLQKANTSWISISVIITIFLVSIILMIGTMRYKSFVNRKKSNRDSLTVSEQGLEDREVLPAGFKEASRAMKPPGFTDVLEVDKRLESRARHSPYSNRGRAPSLSMSFQSVRVLYK